MTSQQSGGTLPTFYIALVDEFGQFVGSDSSSTATIEIIESSNTGAYTPAVTGSKTKPAIKGMFMFDSVTFTAQPGKTYSKCSKIFDPSK